MAVQENDTPKTLIEVQNGPSPRKAGEGLPMTRRRLIKGTSLALPAILTLHSGGSAAVSVLHCASNSAEDNPSGGLPLLTSPLVEQASGNPTLDGWSRLSLDQSDYVLEITTNPGVPAYYADLLDGFPFKYRDASTGEIAAGFTVQGTHPPNTAPLSPGAGNSFYGILFYDVDGNAVSMGPGTTNTAAISAACYDSQFG